MLIVNKKSYTDSCIAIYKYRQQASQRALVPTTFSVVLTSADNYDDVVCLVNLHLT